MGTTTGEIRVGTASITLCVDTAGRWQRLNLGTRAIAPALAHGAYVADGIRARAQLIGEPAADRLDHALFLLRTQPDHFSGVETDPATEVARLRIQARPEKRGGDRIALVVEAIGSETEPAEGDHAPLTDSKQLGFSLFLPASARIHLAERMNVGRLLTSAMPIGESHAADQHYNALAIEQDDGVLLFCVNRVRCGSLRAEIYRHAGGFELTLSWPMGTELLLSGHDDVATAAEAIEGWLRESFKIAPLSDQTRAVPDWVQQIPMVVTCDMLRSDWSTTHRYRDVAELAREMRSIGVAENTVFYIPGWHGAYDSTCPTYRPRPELGGESDFAAMVETIHECGYRVMVHTTGWGIDPYHPDIDNLERLSSKRPDGSLDGWMIPPREMPGMKRIMIDPEPVTLPGGRRITVELPPLPDRCEVRLRVTGVPSGTGRIRLSAGHRSVASPPGWFAEHRDYTFRYFLYLTAEDRRVSFEVEGGEPLPGDGVQLEVERACVPPTPYSSWTAPMLIADTENPEYIDLFVNEIAQTVERFGIDAVHIDATGFDYTDLGMPAAEAFLRSVAKRLPKTAICGEAIRELTETGFWAVCQNATQSLYRSALAGRRRPAAEQGSLPWTAGVAEHYAWLDLASPICSFVSRYVVTYPHLCAANAFVPLGKVCNIFSPRQMPLDQDEHWKVLRDATRLGYVPGLRVNFRKYGLDEQTRQAMLELAGE